MDPSRADDDVEEVSLLTSSSSEAGSIYDGLTELLEPFCDVTSYERESGDEDDEEGERQGHALHQATLQVFNDIVKQREEKIQAEAGTVPDDFCRICRDTDSKELFMSPCKCKGTLASVHLTCLERWLAESDTAKCELCGHEYHIIRTPRFNVFYSFYLWLTRVAAQSLIMDGITLLAFTPIAVMGTYLATLAGDLYYTGPPPSVCARTLALCVISVIATVDTVYLGWLLMRLQIHFRRWYSFWRRNSVVKVIFTGEEKCLQLPPQCQEKQQ